MRRIAGVGLAVMLMACVPKVEQPRVWVAGARLASVGFAGGVVDVRLSVYNPNGFALRASGLTYDVELEDPDGEGWFGLTDGRIDTLEVAAGDTLVVTVPVEFDYGGLGRVLRGLMERGSFEYRIRGVVALEGPIRREIGYRHTGTVTPQGVR